MLHEFGDTAGKPELRSLLRALVVQGDLQSLVQEGQLAQPLCERVEAVGGLFKDAGIGVERNFRPGLARFAGLLQLGSGLALLVALLPHRTLARDFQLQPIGKRVDHGNAHAVQAAGNFVRFAVEFPAGVQHGHNHFRSGTLFRLMHVDGYAAAVVDHGDGVVGMHGHVDFVRETGQGLVDRVVHHFPDQMVQAHFSGRADVHGGTQPHRFQTAKNFDRLRVVLVTRGLHRSAYVFFVTHGFSPGGSLSLTICVAERTPSNVAPSSASSKFSREARKACLRNFAVRRLTL